MVYQVQRMYKRRYEWDWRYPQCNRYLFSCISFFYIRRSWYGLIYIYMNSSHTRSKSYALSVSLSPFLLSSTYSQPLCHFSSHSIIHKRDIHPRGAFYAWKYHTESLLRVGNVSPNIFPSVTFIYTSKSFRYSYSPWQNNIRTARQRDSRSPTALPPTDYSNTNAYFQKSPLLTSVYY